MLRAVFVLVCGALLGAVATSWAQDDDPDLPWFTGPLLVPGATMGGGGSFWVQPYLIAGRGVGVYRGGFSVTGTDETVVNPQLQLGYGFTDNFEIQIDAQAFWNEAQGADTFGPGDTAVELHYLAFTDDARGWRPAVRLDYVQLFPTGQYQSLNGTAKGTDTLGSGTYVQSLVLNLAKTFPLGGEHYLRPDFSVVASLPLDTHVEGSNSYGGGMGTDGTVDPGNSVTFYVSGEYSLTRNWVLALDTTYTYVDTTRFTGNPGTNPDGTPATVGSGSGYQIAVLPQLEYNFDASHGLVAGPWITLAGRNTQAFYSFAISYIVTFDVGTPW